MLQDIRLQLNGLSCFLTPIRPEDAVIVVRLRVNNKVYMKNHPEDRTSLENHKKWYEKYLNKGNDVHWIVRNKVTKEAVGQTALSDFDFNSRKVRSGPILFNDNARIFAIESEILKLEYAFEQLNINKVYVHTRFASKEAVNYLKKMGFSHDGYLRNDWWSGAEFIDYHLFSMLKSEYFNNKDNIYLPYLKKIEKLFGE